MKVFISWSGDRSKTIALGLREFLPDVLHRVKPFMSAHDIEAGARWPDQLNQQLESTDVGVLCFTPENLSSTWLHYEAGALAKKLENSRICTCLYELSPADCKWPLAQFQANISDKEGIRRIVDTINAALADEAQEDRRLSKSFDHFWPELDNRIKSIHKFSADSPSNTPSRTDRELLEELLQLVRKQVLPTSIPPASSPFTMLLAMIDDALAKARDMEIDDVINECQKLGNLLERFTDSNDANEMLRHAISELLSLGKGSYGEEPDFWKRFNIIQSIVCRLRNEAVHR